jgi:hypothetical protein
VTTANSISASTSAPLSLQLVTTPALPPTGPAAGEAADTRNPVAAVIRAIRAIPSLLAKVVNGAKQAFSWFLQNVWPTVRAWVGAIADLVSAWSIWDAFH